MPLLYPTIPPWSFDQEEDISNLEPLVQIMPIRKRGGDTSGATSSPPSSSSSTNDHSSGIPKIDGSSAGFIALVVALSSIVVISCVAVFFLLRNHKRDPYERHARRVLSGKREAVNYETPTGPPGIKAKLKGMFKVGKKREGWVRASSGDDGEEWDVGDDDAQMRTSRTTPSASFTPPARPQPQRSLTSDSIELSAPEVFPPPFNPMAVSIPREAAPYSDPYTTSPTAMVSTEAFPTSQAHSFPEKQQGQNSADSGATTRTFESGSKFKENLDFE